MQEHFTIGTGHQFATLNLDDATANGNGSSTTPRLVLQPRLSVSYPQIGPRGRLSLLRLCATLEFPDRTILDAIPLTLTLNVSAHCDNLPNNLLTFEFPLTNQAIAAIERHRQGGNVKAAFRASLDYEVLVGLDNQTPPQVWALTSRERSHLNGTIDIPGSSWTSRVLPQIGYGVVHVVEFPAIPVEKCAAFNHALIALRQAQDRHLAGLYDDAAAKCRVALDQFFEQVPANDPARPHKTIPKLKQSWEKRLGKATYDWLNDSFSTIKGATNASHHSPNSHFDQLESQLLLAVTTGFVAYAARTFGGNSERSVDGKIPSHDVAASL